MLQPRILRALEDKLARPLTQLFNNSVNTGIIPEYWKSANVTAIHKKGSRGAYYWGHSFAKQHIDDRILHCL